MSENSGQMKITKVIHTTGGTSPFDAIDASDGKWRLQSGNGTSTGNIILQPLTSSPSTWDFATGQAVPAVMARCYSRSCKNETRVITEIVLGSHLSLKTYICEACLEDLALKIKSELGIEEEEEK